MILKYEINDRENLKRSYGLEFDGIVAGQLDQKVV
jgi:hypothetical protein